MVEASPKRHCVLWGTRSPLDCQVPTAAPTQGAGPWSLSLGLPGRGAPRLLPLSIPLAFAPLPRRAFLTPPLPFGGPGSVSSSSAPERTPRLWVPPASRPALGLSPPAPAPDPICHLGASLSPAAMPLLGARLPPVLPGPPPLAPCPAMLQADPPSSPGHHLCLWPRPQQDKPVAVFA